MQTAPCPACGRQVMRDGAVGLLVCSCGHVLEMPTDLEGPIRPKERDLRWHGTDDELEDIHELGLRTPDLPSRKEAIDALERRAAELQAAEAEERERRLKREAEFARLLARYDRISDDVQEG